MIVPLGLTCGQCGYKPQMARLGLTSNAEVAAIWHCQCGNEICQRYPISWLIEHIPSVEFEFSPDDQKLLKEMHIETQ